MTIANETLHLILIFTAFFFIYKGALPLTKIIAGHIPVQGLRQALTA